MNEYSYLSYAIGRVPDFARICVTSPVGSSTIERCSSGYDVFIVVFLSILMICFIGYFAYNVVRK